MEIDPSSRSPSTQCSVLLSTIRKPAAGSSLVVTCSRRRLYLRKPKPSMACLRLPAISYTVAPLARSHRAMAHASAAANVVLTFFLGTKSSASLKRRSFVPAR